ncbi:MAG: N-acyl homoserine lactonase QqlR [Anaerolineae bacterium]
MQLHALRTATIDVKRRYVDGVGPHRVARLINSVLDNRFVRIPVFVWVVEHPEGVIVVDTGMSAHVNERDYFPVVQRPFWRTQYRYHLTAEDEVGAQMRRMGIPPEEVRWVVLTHTHFDHSAALYHFPNAEFIISRREYQDITRFRSAHLGFPSKWPDWLRPTAIDFLPEPSGPFELTQPLTMAGDVRLVPTPGHTPGHLSVLVEDGDSVFFLGGDTSFDLTSLLLNWVDAPTFNATALRRTRERILDYARDTRLIYLTTHDPETATRLEDRVPLSAQQQPSSVGG